MIKTRNILNKDGSYQITKGNTIYIENAYPGLNLHSIRCLSADCTDDTAQYVTSSGKITLHISCNSSNIEYLLSISEFTEKIHTLWYVHKAKLSNALGVYQAAKGMMDDTGYIETAKLSEGEVITSHGLISIMYEDTILTLYVTEHSKYNAIYQITKRSGKLYLSAGFQLENTNQNSCSMPSIKIISTNSIEEGLLYASNEIGQNMNARLHMPPYYGWSSWYYCYENFDLPQLKEYLHEFANLDFAKEIQYFQIDAGYAPSLGDWLKPSHRWPGGLKEGADAIAAKGFTPGIWIGPYMIGNRSTLYHEHPDWVLRDLNGNPIIEIIADNEPKTWGYQDEEYYVLDTSHPDAMEYLRTVFRTLKSFGFKMFKTDFMLWGCHDSTTVKRHTPGKTSVEYFRDLLAMIRKEIGDDSYWLGCIAPFLPFIGYADGIRVGGDVGSTWAGEFGPQNMIKCLTGNNYMNHNYYQIDPDAVMIRDFQIRLTETEINSLALLAGISGGCIYTSDAFHLIKNKNRIDLFKFLKPDARHKAALPLIEDTHDHIIYTHHNKQSEKGLIFIFNKTETHYTDNLLISKLGFDHTWFIKDFQTNEDHILYKDFLNVSIEPHDCKLYVLSKDELFEIDHTSLWNNLL